MKVLIEKDVMKLTVETVFIVGHEALLQTAFRGLLQNNPSQACIAKLQRNHNTIVLATSEFNGAFENGPRDVKRPVDEFSNRSRCFQTTLYQFQFYSLFLNSLKRLRNILNKITSKSYVHLYFYIYTYQLCGCTFHKTVLSDSNEGGN